MSIDQKNDTFNAENDPALRLAAEFAGVPARQVNKMDPAEYDFFQAITAKFNGGFRGMIDLVLYTGFAAGFTSLYISNSSIFTDITVVTNGVSAPFDANITDCTSFINYIVLAGMALCLFRIVFATHFIKEARLNRIIELVWGLAVWVLFIIAILLTNRLSGQLTTSAATNTVINDTEKKTKISMAQKQANVQMALTGVGIGATTLLTAYNIYDTFFLNEQVGRDAPTADASTDPNAAPAPTQ